MENTQDNEPKSVPQEIFDKYLLELQKEGISKDIIDRLKTVLVADGSPSEQAIRKAIFNQE